ncbi:MAG TPA: Uma2 family endonuclease [Thermoanaerobaculia bacterium]|nr:Uma2 family endonuclease [Thermoanaerobaculia bacterium]
MTADELFRLHDPGWRHELVRGELRRKPFLNARQGEVIPELAISLADARAFGKFYAATGYLLARNPDTVRVAEIGFVRNDRVSRTAGYLEGAPDVAFNILASGDDVEEKTREWLSAGASAVVIIDADTETVRIHRTGSTTSVNDVLEIDDVIPGWRLPLAELFA